MILKNEKSHNFYKDLGLNSLPNVKSLEKSNLLDFAQDKINVTHKMNFVVGSVEDIVGKGDNAGYQHCLLFPQCFQNVSLSGLFKVGIMW